MPAKRTSTSLKAKQMKVTRIDLINWFIFVYLPRSMPLDDGNLSLIKAVPTC